MLNTEERKDLANELDSYLTSFEMYVEDQMQDENENLLLDARAIADHIGGLQDVLERLDLEHELISRPTQSKQYVRLSQLDKAITQLQLLRHDLDQEYDES